MSRADVDDHPEASGVGDEVDGLVQAWRRERPDLDVAPLEVLSRVSRLARHLDLARREAFEAHQLDSWEFDVLAALRREGAPYALSPGRLVQLTLVTSGTMTNRIDRLESRDLVSRIPDPNDGRSVQVVLTEEGKTAVDAALTDLLAHERTILSTITARQREQLAELLRYLTVPFEQGPEN
jgi:DNA-binding MarR family transcriptional regulator